MKKLLFLGFLFIAINFKLSAQNNSVKNFRKEWAKVERLELDDLTKSALREVENIYKKVRFSKNKAQIIKCLLYKSKFSLTLNDDAELDIVNTLKKEITSNDFPTKNILESILADLYWQYYKNNSYKFYSRSKTDKKIDSLDFRTWDLETLFEETHKYYQLSLANGNLLQKTSLKNFNPILIIQNESKIYRPTLYDFIAQRALDFYKSDDRYIVRPSHFFKIENPILLSDNTKFLAASLQTKDSLSQKLNALYLFKKLTQFHLNDKKANALIDITLQRLNYVRLNTFFDNKDSLYLNTLHRLKYTYKKKAISTEITYKIASFLFHLSESYYPKKDTTNRWKKREALKLCNEAIKAFPKSKGANKCMDLRDYILNEKLTIDSEKFIPINKFSRLLITYKNINQLYFRAYKVAHKGLISYTEIYNDSLKTNFINKLKAPKTWTVKLHDENDYQQHQTEILVPKLDQGSYIIFALPTKEFDYQKAFAYRILQVTDLALIEKNQTYNYSYQVVNRNNGAQIVGAKVNLKNYLETPKINKLFRTNKKGQITYRNRKYYKGVNALISF